MADPVLRIPVDDAAFQRYMEAFQRYQTQLQEQPDMWDESNAAVQEGVAANLALADAIGASVAAAVRLGDQQERNAQQRKRNAQEEDSEQKRASTWRRAAIDHVQELSRTTATVVRSLGGFAAGNAGAGGLFGMVSNVGRQLGGTLGGIVNLAGEALNANYLANNAIADKGQFARGIGATVGQQEGFQLQLGRYVNTDQGIDAVMNARGDPREQAAFHMLGVDFTRGSNSDVYAATLRAQVKLAERNMDKNGNIQFIRTDALGGSAYGTSHEDLNRLVGADRAGNLEKAIKEAVSFKSPVDKQIDAATKSAVATDKLVQVLTDQTQVMLTKLNPGTDKLIEALTKLTNDIEGITDLLSFKFLSPDVANTPEARAQWAKDHPTLAAMGIHPNDGHDKGLSPTAPEHDPADAQWHKDHPWIPSFVHLTKQPPASRVGYGSMSRAIPTTPDSSLFGTTSAAEAALAGIGAHVTSRFRTYAEQAALYEKYLHHHGALAAPPGHSDHETGHALDISRGAGISKDSIRAALARAHIVAKQILDEGDHYHVGLYSSSGPLRPAPAGASNVQVHVKVSAPPGHQTAVSANGAARGG